MAELGTARIGPSGTRVILDATTRAKDDQETAHGPPLPGPLLRCGHLPCPPHFPPVLPVCRGGVRHHRLSVLIALNLIYFGGLTLNLLTLMGIGHGLWAHRGQLHRRLGERIPAVAGGGRRPFWRPRRVPGRWFCPSWRPPLPPSSSLFHSSISRGAQNLLRSPGPSGGPHAFGLPLRSLHLHPGPGRPDPGGGQGPALTYQVATPNGSTGGQPPLYIRLYRGLIGFTLRRPWLTVVVAAGALGRLVLPLQ